MGRHREPGHRQRGAGTVSVAKEDTRHQGVVCKEWQRTPMQLLQAFCQSTKRRNALYTRVGTPVAASFRVRCVLPDAKDRVKDLVFCPVQECPTLDAARHCAALLALKHVAPRQPLERQLPDPYRHLWLALDGLKAGKKTSKTEQLTSKTEEQNPKMEEQNPKREEKKYKTEQKINEGLELWTREDDEAETNKMPVLLTMDRSFASFKEVEAARVARTQERRQTVRARANRERANGPRQVMMSAPCREVIEAIVREGGRWETTTGKGMMSVEEEDLESEQSHFEAAACQEHVIKRLRASGFTPTQIQGALQNCKRDLDMDDEVHMSTIFDWLCLNIPEGELPKKFNPEGTQLDVVLSTSLSGATDSPRTVGLVQRLMKFGYDHHDADSVANEFVHEHPGISEEELKAPSMETLFALLAKLFPHVKKHFSLEEIGGAVEAPGNEEELLNQRQDEVFALEAIYDEKLKITTLENGLSTQLLMFEVTDTLRLHIFLSRTSKYPLELPLLALTSTEAQHQPHLLAACGEALRSCVHSLGDPMLYDIYVAIDSYLQDKKRLSTRSSRIQLLEKVVVVDKMATATFSRTETQTNDNFKARKTKNGPGGNHSKKLNQHQPKHVDVEAVHRTSENLLMSRKAKDSQHNFQQMLAARAKLPAGKEEAQVIKCVQNNQVVLICGATGCGKTTQIPQFILDEYINRGAGGECNIICTQPRRIAAIGVATRVAQERCEEIADIVGYQIRMDAKKSSNTRLLFCTTGVLLQRLLNDRQMSGVSHIIVDEVHERNVDTDFLLSILRDLLPERPDLRVILMSATMNSELFVKYFSSITRTPCPVLDIPGFTYPVECNFLEDVLDQTHYDVPKYLLKNKKSKKVGGDGEDAEEKLLSELTPKEIAARVDDSKIDYDLIVHLVRYLVLEKAQSAGSTNGAILVFLPGTAEIKRLVEILTHGNGGLSSKLWALPLHGSLSGADQAMVFKSATAGKTKVIVSTNIAETSITIDDITAVIDSGKVKEMIYDSRTRRSQLLDCWASRAACDQRKGRAGRVQAGTCYRLFSRKRFAAMDAQLSAEIHRVSLEQLCLQIKKLELGSIKGFLSKAIEPPAEDAIDAAIEELVAIAAFRMVHNTAEKKLRGGMKSIHDEEVVLTPLGNHLAMLPLDARIGKFLVYGSILRCIHPVAIIATCISSRTPFLMSMSDPEMRAKQDALKKELGGSWKSDHLLLWKLVERYIPLRGQKMKREFCRDIGLSYDTMESILDLKQQYLQQLNNIGFYEPYNADNINENSNAPRIIKAALCAGLYANVAQVVYPEQKYFQAAHGVVEEDHNAKQIRYFVRSTTEAGQRERVFLHPSSCNFSQTNYDSPWLLYTELVQTSKIFVRESTMVNPYALLLFGGQLEVIHEKNLLILDGFIRFNAVARIGVLIKSIRQHLDRLLMEKIADPSVDIAQSQLVTAISHLLKSEGMYVR